MKPEYNYPLAAVVLAGGQGTRLREVTQGKIPKSGVTLLPSERLPGHDFVLQVIHTIGLSQILWVADTHLDYYHQHLDTSNSLQLLPQNLWPNTAGAIIEALTQIDSKTQLLIMTSDLLCAPEDIYRLVENHQPGNLTWATAPLGQPLMTGYESLLIDDQQQIVGDTDLAPLQPDDFTPTTTVTKLGLQIVDPNLIMTAWELGQAAELPTDKLFDWYWGLCPLLEIYNRQRLANNQPSQLNAINFAHPAIDYGTPERLAISRWLSTLLLMYA